MVIKTCGVMYGLVNRGVVLMKAEAEVDVYDIDLSTVTLPYMPLRP